MHANGSLRLFVAVYPPVEAAASLVQRLAALDLPPHRQTPPEQCHLTLQFIGDTAPSRLSDVVESMERSAAGLDAFNLTPLRLVSLPHRGPARLVAAETDCPATLLELQRRLVLRLAHRPRGRVEERFLPHLTLCRFRSPTRIKPIEAPIEAEAFRVGRVVLLESRLLPSGAEHREVASAALGDRSAS